jgi:hypothetical protein
MPRLPTGAAFNFKEEEQMAVGCYIEFEGATQQQYDRVSEALGLDSPNPEWPEGIISHTSGPSENGNWCVVDCWESREAFNRFFESRLKNALEQGGMPRAEPRWFEVYNQYVNESAQPSTLRRAA